MLVGRQGNPQGFSVSLRHNGADITPYAPRWANITTVDRPTLLMWMEHNLNLLMTQAGVPSSARIEYGARWGIDSWQYAYPRKFTYKLPRDPRMAAKKLVKQFDVKFGEDISTVLHAAHRANDEARALRRE